MNKKLISALAEIRDIRLSENEPMSKHTTFKIGGPAKVFVEIKSLDAAIKTFEVLNGFETKPTVIGNGSNLLFSDEVFDGVVIKLSCNKISVEENTLHADAGALLSVASVCALKSSLSGLEFAQGIPGSIGGALVMNAGAYGSEISDILVKSTYLYNGKVFDLTRDGHDFSYRESFYKKNPGSFILSAEFELRRGDPERIAADMKELATRRREKQPLEFPSAGSVFKRPVGYFAGALIEQCNLKGFSIGGAQVSEKHAGFIINRGGATADDVKKLISHIQETVLKETGVSLECEICIL